jgi:hypothetical protein
VDESAHHALVFMCYWKSVCVCLLLQDLVQRCLHGGGGDMGGHVLRETTSRGLCGLVCPSRTKSVWSVCVYYCRTYYKAVRVGEEESGGHVL